MFETQLLLLDMDVGNMLLRSYKCNRVFGSVVHIIFCCSLYDIQCNVLHIRTCSQICDWYCSKCISNNDCIYIYIYMYMYMYTA